MLFEVEYTGQDAFNDMLPVIENYTGGGIAATLDASYWKGAGARNGKEREFICICWKEVHSPQINADRMR